MLFIIGLGLNENGISREGIEAVKKCKKVYLENYTVNLPYSASKIEQLIKKKIVTANREFVESLEIIGEAKKSNVALLVYGSPLTATTHISLIQEAKNKRIKTKIMHNASIIDAVAETGLQIYKFGKIASMPNFEVDSYINVIRENINIGAHTLILTDIGLKSKDALNKLTKNSEDKIKLDKAIICEHLGAKDSKIYYGEIEKLKRRKIKMPFCLIVPGKLHFLEKEILEGFEQ